MTYTFRAVFPITDDGQDMTRAQLIEEAQNGPLADLLWENDAVLIGLPEWTIDTDDNGDPVLIAEGPARRWDDRTVYRHSDWVDIGKRYDPNNSPAANKARRLGQAA